MFLPVILSMRPKWTYTPYKIYGFTVEVGSEELTDPYWPQAEAVLVDQLFRICRVVPNGPLSKLKTIKFWFHRNDPLVAGAAYHPGAQWLKDHGDDPQMGRGVEIGNSLNLIGWSHDQPWMLLHELSHGYQDQFLPGGFSNPDIKAAYDHAMASHKYDHVLHFSGGMVKAYAETNPMEFFAECCEAYFGKNDIYPFVNAELKTFDPQTYAILLKIWGKPAQNFVPLEPTPTLMSPEKG